MTDIQNIYKDKLVFYRYDLNSKYVEIDLATKLNIFEFENSSETINRYKTIFYNEEFLDQEIRYNNNKYLISSDSSWMLDLVDGRKVSISMSYSVPLQSYYFSYEQIGKNTNKLSAMNEINIGDPISKLNGLSFELVAEESNTIKYKTKNGNDFSITHHDGLVVFMENDWLENEKGKIPLCSNFVYGKTTIKDIRDFCGSNGFVYNNLNLSNVDDVIMFNCYGINSSDGEVIVFITKSTKVAISTNKDKVDEHLKLTAIIIAKQDYLDYLWGKEKTFDPDYKTLKR